MSARFLLSLDCEGKWGVADCLSRREHRWLTDERLRWAYGGVVGLLDRLEIPATFAFVGLFGESAESFRRLMPEVKSLSDEAPHYLGPALQDIGDGSRQGWHGAWAVEIAAKAKAGHEIALHGVTHLPWTSAGPAFFARELALVSRLSAPLSAAKTFVFPRNLVAQVELLKSAGLKGYRQAPPKRSRSMKFLSELNVLELPDDDPPQDPALPVAIPGGFFVNWRHGLRSLIPESLSHYRLKRLLERAERTNGIVHLWLHPENVASAPATLDLLEAMLTTVANYREQGRCTVLRQIDYVSSRR